MVTGQIVEEGETVGTFDILVDSETDVGRVREALGFLAGRANIKVRDDTKPPKGPTVSLGRSRTPRRREERRDRR